MGGHQEKVSWYLVLGNFSLLESGIRDHQGTRGEGVAIYLDKKPGVLTGR